MQRRSIPGVNGLTIISISFKDAPPGYAYYTILSISLFPLDDKHLLQNDESSEKNG